MVIKKPRDLMETTEHLEAIAERLHRLLIGLAVLGGLWLLLTIWWILDWLVSKN